MDGYLTAREIADRLGIKRDSIYRYRKRGDIPEPDTYAGHTPLWKESAIARWIESRPGHGWRKGGATEK